jgi:hypothetical protein
MRQWIATAQIPNGSVYHPDNIRFLNTQLPDGFAHARKPAKLLSGLQADHESVG